MGFDKPKPTAVEQDANAIEAFINKGGSVAVSEQELGAILKRVQLRLPPALLERIDGDRGKRTVPPSRHAWFLEAVLEKLDATKNGGQPQVVS